MPKSLKNIEPIGTGDFGPIYNQFKGRAKEAIQFLIEKQDGECVAALFRPEIGWIDIIWGQSNFGLKHIIEKHGSEIEQLGFKVEDFIPITISFGNFYVSREEDKVTFESEMFRIVIKTSWNNETKRFVLTAYDLRKKNKSFGISGSALVTDFTNETLLHSTNDLHHKDTTKKNKSQDFLSGNSHLGATEILAQNPKELNFNGYKPTYKILSDYSHLIDKADNKTKLYQRGELPETLDAIQIVIRKNHKQCKALAEYLKADTLSQTCFNIWHWMVTNIKYRLDTPGTEELRSPARSYQLDRFTGIDCDDYTIFSCCLLLNLGYVPVAYIVAFNGNDNFQHIYTVCNGNVIDGVMKEYGIHPRNITKTKVMPLAINMLSGIDNNDTDLAGWISKADKVVTPQSKDYNKIKAIKMLSGDEQRRLIEIMPAISHITDNGTAVFHTYGSAALTGHFLGSLDELDKLQGLGADSEVTETARNIIKANYYDNLSGALNGLGDLGELGSWLKKLAGKAKDAVKKVTTTVATAAKTVAKTAVNIAEKGVQLLEKVGLMLPRLAFLALMKANVAKLATKLVFGYCNQAQATAKKLDLGEWKKLTDAIAKLEKFWKLAGGDTSALRNAIVSGSGKSLDGLGDDAPPVDSTSEGVAKPFLDKIMDWIKGIDFGKLVTTAGEVATGNFIAAAKDLTNLQKKQAPSQTPIKTPNQIPTKTPIQTNVTNPVNNSGTPSSIPWVPIAIGVGVVAILVLRK